MANSASASCTNGRGVPQDDAEAAKWYRKSAAQGHANGQNSLGIHYATGQGVPQDFVLAHMWLSLSAAQGHKPSATNRDLMAKLMSPTDISKAQKMAREWKPKK